MFYAMHSRFSFVFCSFDEASLHVQMHGVTGMSDTPIRGLNENSVKDDKCLLVGQRKFPQESEVTKTRYTSHLLNFTRENRVHEIVEKEAFQIESTLYSKS